jgi:hypothetical protein
MATLSDLLEIKEKIGELKADVRNLVALLERHTDQDMCQFTEIKRALQDLVKTRDISSGKGTVIKTIAGFFFGLISASFGAFVHFLTTGGK